MCRLGSRLLVGVPLILMGCQSAPRDGAPSVELDRALTHYATRAGQPHAASRAGAIDEQPDSGVGAGRGDRRSAFGSLFTAEPRGAVGSPSTERYAFEVPGAFFADDVPSENQQKRARDRAGLTPGADHYWCDDFWHQLGHETEDWLSRGLWHSLKVSYWDVENAAFITTALGASIIIRETDVDGTVRSRVRGHRQLGGAGEPIQILGHPLTHFSIAGAMWIGSTLRRDEKSHEFSRSLLDALTVNGITVGVLKYAVNTRSPNGDNYSWPSGHTSSSFTAAAVVNEHYGPWWGVPSFVLATLVGYERLDAGDHDLSDVVFGAVLGTVVGTSIARDGKARWPELWGMEVLPYQDTRDGRVGVMLHKGF